MKRIGILFLMMASCFFARTSPVLSQSPDTVLTISLSAAIYPRQVHLNQQVTLSLVINWQGTLDQLEIDKVEDPVLNNLEIVSTSVSNRMITNGAQHRVQKEIGYTLAPKTEGMAYVESIRVSYRERGADGIRFLRSQRLGVKVLPPLPQRGQRLPFWLWLLPLLLLSGAFWFYKRRRNRSSADAGKETVILEEEFLSLLKEEVDLSNSTTAAGVMALSRLLRRYLAEKFGIPALEMTTSELVEALNQQEIEEDQIEKFRALLENADVVKFSGQSAEPARLTEWYSVVEAWLERELQKHAAETRAEESRKKKKFLRK